jgi:RNA polymerase sigma-70 factor (ECF subfamily)
MTTDVKDAVYRARPVEFEGFYRAAWLEVYRPLAAAIGDRDLAREAVDEAMVRAYDRWSKVSRYENREGWVYRVAYRWAIDRLRHRTRERRYLPRLASGSEPEMTAIVEPGLGRALSALSVEQRSVIVLACAFDWSERQIAEALGIRPGTVKSRLHRGMRHLREELNV